jgi:transposase
MFRLPLWALLIVHHLSFTTMATRSYFLVNMPRKPRIKPIRQFYSWDLKRRVIYQAYTLHKTSTQIAIDLDMPLRVVQRVWRCWREIGEVCKDRVRMGRAPIMTVTAVDVSFYSLQNLTSRSWLIVSPFSKFILGLLEHSPDLYLDEIQEQLFSQHDVDVSLATIWRTLKRLGMSSKSVR